MSFCTFGVAVAVTAMKGTPGRLSLSAPSCLNCSASNTSSGSCQQAGPTEACMQRQCTASRWTLTASGLPGPQLAAGA